MVGLGALKVQRWLHSTLTLVSFGTVQLSDHGEQRLHRHRVGLGHGHGVSDRIRMSLRPL